MVGLISLVNPGGNRPSLDVNLASVSEDLFAHSLSHKRLLILAALVVSAYLKYFK